MNFRTFAFGALGLLAANAAHADVVFDNVTAVSSSGSTGAAANNTTIMGASFTSGMPDVTSVGLFVDASAPGGTGSTLVYIVPDDDTGGATGIAGNPTTPTPAELIGTISDASLTSTFSLLTLPVSSPFSTPNADQEYWVLLESTDASTLQWSYALDGSGFGTAGQNYVNNFGASPLTGASDTTGGYQMVVAAPEPASLGIIGMGLAGLGFFRRRKTDRA